MWNFKSVRKMNFFPVKESYRLEKKLIFPSFASLIFLLALLQTKDFGNSFRYGRIFNKNFTLSMSNFFSHHRLTYLEKSQHLQVLLISSRYHVGIILFSIFESESLHYIIGSNMTYYRVLMERKEHYNAGSTRGVAESIYHLRIMIMFQIQNPA